MLSLIASTAGAVGLFIGAVVLAVGYQIIMGWVDNDLEQRKEANLGAAE